VRLRIVATLALMLMVFVSAAVLGLGGLLAWNLSSGFADYLATRDLERLERFATLVASYCEARGGASALTNGSIDMRELLLDMALRDSDLAAAHPPALGRPPPPPDGPPAARAPPGAPPFSGRFDPARPPPDVTAPFGDRVAIYSAEGRLLLGPELPNLAATVSEPVLLQGKLIAQVRLLPAPPLPGQVEIHFLRRQYIGIAAFGVSLLLIALASAHWLGRRWVRPLLAVQDVTERIARGEPGVRLAERPGDEIGDVIHNINRMAEDLQRLETARRRWIAEISHELRTPLTVIRGEVEALVEGVRPLTPRAILSLREEVQKLGAIVEDLHLLALSDLKALPCNFGSLDAVELVRRVVHRFERQAAERGLTIELQVPADGPVTVHWDARRIEQLLANLLDNSLRYTDPPGRIRLSLTATESRVHIDIEDSAPTVKAADLARLFESMFRADAARGRHSGGSGLGLSICRAFALAHGGDISATGAALGGLHVQVDLPATAVLHT
jgi:two-component system, OmpR family, sensor histidine kinase BaeS